MPIIPKRVTYLEKVIPGENVSKFWALTFEPTTSKVPAIRVWWGRIGTVGNTKVLGGFSSDEIAILEATRRTQEKLSEGYVRKEVVGWWPECIKQADRAPSIEGYGTDGWPIVEGRERRPDKKADPVVRPVRRADPPLFRERPRVVVERVVISTERVIDFEE